jgi:hypothetical protein
VSKKKGEPRKAITASEAYRVYAAMPASERAMLPLEKLLKSQGYAISRRTLSNWNNEHRWDMRLQKKEGVDAVTAPAAEIERVTAEELEGVTTIDEVLVTCAKVAVGLGQTSLATIAAVEIHTIEDAARLSKAMTDVAVAMANIQKTLSEIGASTVETLGPTPSVSSPVDVAARIKAIKDAMAAA